MNDAKRPLPCRPRNLEKVAVGALLFVDVMVGGGEGVFSEVRDVEDVHVCCRLRVIVGGTEAVSVLLLVCSYEADAVTVLLLPSAVAE